MGQEYRMTDNSGHTGAANRKRDSGKLPLHPLSPEEALRGAAGAGPVDGEPRRRDRRPDEPTSPHHAEHDAPAERAKTAMRKAGERNRRVKRPGASGIRGGTSKD
jgi:hypothetical protein